ncbi:toxin-antitoxin system TumE family protein [Geoalkalibacter subterraneus]|uniref:Uncharacterized protein n=1 Tax=Geoalkalibacter subterraneus TaxID=483547 RepID=A0A0B5FVV3_9BACT|nr:DUF6516 family protein [Geoalkalibacter subterraneus]AJF08275.1 hypothetical protein GSUB_17515 [Geoalkalibacter subterraneus]
MIDNELNCLLDLDRETFHMERGFWVKFDVRQVESSRQIPHGIRYSASLHDSRNRRILGFDNAHGYDFGGRNRYRARKVTWDHIHREDRVEEYEFASAAQLLEDFWREAREIIDGGKNE